jgi:SAM-dependent methyltransferase
VSVETFDAAWLALREGVDHRSRAAGLLAPLRAWWTARRAAAVLDLGCGTGSNLRYLAPKLPGRQTWTLVDHDAGLLARVEAPSADVNVLPVRADLADVGPWELAGVDLVTASALLDLVSRSWLAALVDSCADARCGVLFALTYDGTIDWLGRDADAGAGSDPLDAWVRDAVNRHQRRDKGLGLALGPTAGPVAEALFRARSYRTWLLPSPWRLGPGDAELAHRLVTGWSSAALEERPEAADAVRNWGERRTWSVGREGFGLVVGHLDLLALPVEGATEPR